MVLHGASAYRLSRRDLKARATPYAHKPGGVSYATRTMRWGGVIRTVHSGEFQEGRPYENVVGTFSTWYDNVIHIVAMLAIGVGNARRDRVLKAVANTLAVILTVG